MQRALGEKDWSVAGYFGRVSERNVCDVLGLVDL